MENDESDSKLKIEGNSASIHESSDKVHFKRSNRFSFRAPQENLGIQDFELGKIYGVGSYSKVVKAKKKDTGMVSAMKIMDKKFIAKENKTAYVKFERLVLDQMDHPGIVQLLFTFQDTFSLYMALEPCDGGELYDLINRKVRLSEDEARFYIAEVVDALEYVHGVGLIHRDIKPENLLLTANGHIKIADFGSVKPMKGSQIIVLPDSASDNKACTFVGTAAYVPPEVLNSSPATYGHDLWALGCTLYQMLSGTSPFKDSSEWLIFQRIIARDIIFPNYFSPEARDLIDQLLDIDPIRRPGAGPGGYATLKSHPFFNRINWTNLREQVPPALALEQVRAADWTVYRRSKHTLSRRLKQFRREEPPVIDTKSVAMTQLMSPLLKVTMISMSAMPSLSQVIAGARSNQFHPPQTSRHPSTQKHHTLADQIRDLLAGEFSVIDRIRQIFKAQLADASSFLGDAQLLLARLRDPLSGRPENDVAIITDLIVHLESILDMNHAIEPKEAEIKEARLVATRWPEGFETLNRNRGKLFNKLDNLQAKEKTLIERKEKLLAELASIKDSLNHIDTLRTKVFKKIDHVDSELGRYQPIMDNIRTYQSIIEQRTRTLQTLKDNRDARWRRAVNLWKQLDPDFDDSTENQ